MSAYFNASPLVRARATLPPRRRFGTPVRPSRHPTILRSPGAAGIRGNSGETPDSHEPTGRTRQPPSSIPVKSVNGLPRHAYDPERQNQLLWRITYRAADTRRFLNVFVWPECRKRTASGHFLGGRTDELERLADGECDLKQALEGVRVLRDPVVTDEHVDGFLARVEVQHIG